jgi:shikimate kinase
MNIVLIGYRGTGKSAVGAVLAGRLNMKCISMDEKIVEKAKMTIPEIVAECGWPGFRDLESEVARELAALDNIIIDTGGGVIERPESIELLKTRSRIFWLKAGVDTVVSRISNDTQRPALTDGKTFTEEVAEVLAKRIPKYRDAADFEIDTETRTPEEVANLLIEKLKCS